MLLVPKGPGSGSGCQLEAVGPERGLGGRERGLRHGRRGPNKVAASTGCCVSKSKPRNATSAKEIAEPQGPAQKLGGNTGPVTVVGVMPWCWGTGQGWGPTWLSSCAFPCPHCLGQMIIHGAGLPWARSTPGGPGEPLGQWVAPRAGGLAIFLPWPNPEGQA